MNNNSISTNITRFAICDRSLLPVILVAIEDNIVSAIQAAAPVLTLPDPILRVCLYIAAVLTILAARVIRKLVEVR